MNKFIMGIKNPRLVLMAFLNLKIFRLLSDSAYLKLRYFITLGEKLNLKNPKTFNEKLQWLKINDRKAIYTTMADKYSARQFIQNKYGKEYLIPLLGIWNKFDEIDFEKLPNQFVIKCTHDSASTYICKDKSKLNIKKLKKHCNKHLKKSYYYYAREWPYKNITPRIICEKYMINKNKKRGIEYKLICIQGKVQIIYARVNNEPPKGTTLNFFDTNWNELPLKLGFDSTSEVIKKPVNLSKMIEIAEEISKDIIFIRVDFYEIDNKLYIGELTFYPHAGWLNIDYDETTRALDELLQLPLQE